MKAAACAPFAFILVFALFLAVSGSHSRCSSAVRLVRPEGKVACKNADFWATAWWRWYLTSPANMDPVLDTTGQFCGVNQRGPVWFLAGTISSTPAVPIHRTCAIPSNKFIFVPVLNTAWINFQTDPTFRDLEGSLALAGSFDTLVNPTLEINKKSINITAFKQESEKLIFFTGSPGDVIYSIGAPANITKFSVAQRSYGVLLKPLKKGQRARIHFTGSFADGTSLDVSYKLTGACPKHGHKS